MIDLLVIIDATGKAHLDKLTMHRMPGALPFAGKIRLIDFALSNCKHAGVFNVSIFLQGNYRSLQDHVGSGKRWDLDRRRDGLFILPPKHATHPSMDSLTLQRMHEHIEYFRRSGQSHVVLMPANLVWSVDLNAFLQTHIAAGADISEVIADQRLGVFILSREKLLEYIEQYDTLPYRTVEDIVDGVPNLKKNLIRHGGFMRKIDDVTGYFHANLDMLSEPTLREVFNFKRPIFSKEKPAPPARYGSQADVENSLIASGCRIDGRVSHSVIGRDSVIEPGAFVEHAVVMNNVHIESNAHVRHAILDKQSIVRENAVIHGTFEAPYLTQKAQTLTAMTSLRILHVGSECHPFAKTGGLADVIEGLARHSVRDTNDVAVVIPCYAGVRAKFEHMRLVSKHVVDYGDEPHDVTLYHLRHHNIDVYFIDAFRYFARDRFYGYDDDCDRFTFFNVAVARILDTLPAFDIIHLHDWHAAVLATILKQKDTPAKTVLTLHNVDYQGVCPVAIAQKCGIQTHPNGTFNMLERGIADAHRLTTVSPTYRDELRDSAFGKNLTAALIKRERAFYGVLNGLSEDVNPMKDPLIAKRYDIDTVHFKAENKRFLQKSMQLPLDSEALLIGSVGRIIEQKGFDILRPVLKQCLERGARIQYVLLGDGEPSIIERLQALQKAYPENIALNIGYDAAVPNIIFAGADLFIMPSRVEPCGLSQMIAMKYGTPPLVHHTGGLADTVSPYDHLTHHGNGFSFHEYTPAALMHALSTAARLFKENPAQWEAVQKQAMRADFSLDKQALKMLEIYNMML